MVRNCLYALLKAKSVDGNPRSEVIGRMAIYSYTNEGGGP
jgi:hypothetical protein